MIGLKLGSWGYVGLSLVLGSQACGGNSLHSTGELNTAGKTAAGGTTATSAAGDAGESGSHDGGVGGTNIAAGGRGGVAPDPIGNDGGVHTGVTTELMCDSCELLTTGEEVSAIVATSDTLYWIDHGRYDGLQNHQSDGQLLSMPVSGGTPQVVAEGLEGPIALELSPQHFYLLMDEASSAGGKSELIRVPRAGGDAEVLQSPFDGGSPRWAYSQLAFGSGHAAWLSGTTVYRVADAPGSKPEILTEADGVLALFGDESQVFLLDEEGLTTIPFTGGERTPFSQFDNALDADVAHSYTSLTVAGDFIYAVEYAFDHVNLPAWYLDRMPKTGGAWQRLLEMPAQPDRMALAGEGLAVASPNLKGSARNGRRLLTGSLSGPGSLELTVIAPLDGDPAWRSEVRAWDYSTAGLFLAESGRIYRAPPAN